MTKNELQYLCKEINNRFNQEHMPTLYKVYNFEKNQVVFYEIGAVVYDGKLVYNITEDDGFWFLEDNRCYNATWIPSYVAALSIISAINNNKIVWELHDLKKITDYHAN